jgi:glycerol-3-phosphate acyltransferase PlsX
MLVLSVDLMGGDKAPKATIYGIKYAIEKHQDVRFLCFGSKSAIEKAKHVIKSERCEYFESNDDITAEDKVSIAMRKKTSSMAMALEATKEGKSQATISSGNTGALMSLSKLYFRTIEGIERPAICTVIPTIKSTSVLLDMGANIECTKENLLDFAIMGSAFVKSGFGIENPTVGIVNIGTEETKGTPLVQESYKFFKESVIAKNFTGFIEGDKMHNGDCNVIVTDGFTGNVILKTMEGSGKTMKYFLRHYLMKPLFGKFVVFLGYFAFKNIERKINPNNYNGAMFVGLNGIAVKSHGSSNAKGFANAIGVAINLVKSDINKSLKEEIKLAHK